MVEPPRRVFQQVVMDDVPRGEVEAVVNAGRAAGDCLRACVASLLDLPIEEVPHFVQYIEHPKGTDTSLWFWALLGFCNAYGWRVDYEQEKPDGWSLIDGRSPRGHMHVVVAFDGEMVHDPHPSGDGIVEVEGYFTFRTTSASSSPSAARGDQP